MDPNAESSDSGGGDESRDILRVNCFGVEAAGPSFLSHHPQGDEMGIVVVSNWGLTIRVTAKMDSATDKDAASNVSKPSASFMSWAAQNGHGLRSASENKPSPR